MLSNVIQLVVILVVFILILVAAYFTSRWVGKGGLVSSTAKNIQVIETFKLSQTKYIQIVRIGEKYCAIGIAKDTMIFITELSSDELDLSGESSQMSPLSFKDFYERMIHKDKDQINKQ